jgi:diacyltrehalose acyltransferase
MAALGRRLLRGAAAVLCAAACGAVPTVPHPPARSTEVGLASIAFGLGGAGDRRSERVDGKFRGHFSDGYDTFFAVHYPAFVPIDGSVDTGVDTLRMFLAGSGVTTPTRVIGYSEGAVVAERLKRALATDPAAPPAADLDFVYISSPTSPNGLYTRFGWLPIPGFTSTGAAAPSRYDETFVSFEYEGISDFPASFNPLAIANAVVGWRSFHGDATPDAFDFDDPANADRIIKTVIPANDEHGRQTYYLIRAEQLPLLKPIRDVSAALHLSDVTDPVLDAIEPTLRQIVDSAYPDRTTAAPQRFSLFAPPRPAPDPAGPDMRSGNKVTPRTAAPPRHDRKADGRAIADSVRTALTGTHTDAA